MTRLLRMFALIGILGALVDAQNIDFSNAQTTRPFAIKGYEPGRCALGEVYISSLNGRVRYCVATNTFADLIDVVGDYLPLLAIAALPPGTTSAVKFAAANMQFIPGDLERPTCDETVRGLTWYVPGAQGAADTISICAKAANDAYAWTALF